MRIRDSENYSMRLGLGLGLGMISSSAPAHKELVNSTDFASLVSSILYIPDGKVPDGTLIRAIAIPWLELVRYIGSDWAKIHDIPPEKMEELVAEGYIREGYEVILTPRSRDYGRDVIATKKGVGTIKVLESVKKYKPGHNVSYDDIRALWGVVCADNAFKGVLTTTSDFPSEVMKDRLMAPLINEGRLELKNREALLKWLEELSKTSK